MNTATIELVKTESGQNLPTPKYATSGSAGMDLYADVNDAVTLKSGEHLLVSAGISIALPKRYEAQIRPRSGLAAKYGITVLNTPGTIDSDYRGEIKVILINLSKNDFVIERGMRIAQMVIAPVTMAEIKETQTLETNTDRGTGGFGSTGIKA